MALMEAKWIARLPGLLVLLGVIVFGCSGQKKDETERVDVAPETEVHPAGLQAQLDSARNAFMATAPGEMIQDFETGIARIRESGVLDSALKVGDRAPEFELTEVHGKPINLYSLLERQPVVLIFYRGGWCPYCNLQLRAFNDALPRIKEAGGLVMAVSPEMLDSALSTSQRNQLGFYVFSDNQNEVARKFGIVYTLPEEIRKHLSERVDLFAYNMSKSNELPLAATYVIGTDGVIRYAFLEADHRQRAEPEDVIRVLEQLR